MKKSQPKPQNQRGALVMAGVGLVLIVLVIVGVVAASRGPRPASVIDAPQMITLDATTVFNLTKLPDATPLSADAASPYIALGKMIDSCPDFDAAHLNQMHQHLLWILNPSEIPSNFVAAAIGTDPTGKLLFGMGSFAQNQWIQLGNKPDSCVVPVGKKLNEMLASLGELQFKVFQ